MDQQWNCSLCTYSNVSTASNCEMCGNKNGTIANTDEWACDACTFSNKSTASKCAMCNQTKPAAKKLFLNQMRTWELTTALDDDEQESIVTGDDLRKSIYDYPNLAKESIIHCIGKLDLTYKYPLKSFSRSAVGTGTVFAVDNKQNAHVLTAAHNLRLKVTECTVCNKYYLKKTQCCNTNLPILLIAATKIEFVRQCTEYGSDFGKPLILKKCTEVFNDDKNYKMYPSVSAGFDIAVVKFNDSNNFYAKYVSNIVLQKIYAQQLKSIPVFNIFGYPYERPVKYQKIGSGTGGMFGMESAGNNYSIEMHHQTNRRYLKQRAIDTSPGQSGSCLWYKDPKTQQIIIFAVHTGGHTQTQIKKEPSYNIATMIDYPSSLQLYAATDHQLMDFIEKYKLYQLEQALFEQGVTIDFLLSQSPIEIENIAK
eukprot:295813_1